MISSVREKVFISPVDSFKVPLYSRNRIARAKACNFVLGCILTINCATYLSVSANQSFLNQDASPSHSFQMFPRTFVSLFLLYFYILYFSYVRPLIQVSHLYSASFSHFFYILHFLCSYILNFFIFCKPNFYCILLFVIFLLYISTCA